MPTVPQYRQQVQRSALPNAQLNMQASGEAAGGALAAASQQVGQQATQYAAEEKRKADQLALLAADNKLAEWEASFMNDPEQGLLNQLGSAAFTAPETFSQEFERVAGEVEQGLANDTQKAAFANFRQQRQSSMFTAVQRHTARQMKSFEDQEVKSALDLSKQNAITYFDDPDRVELEIARQIATVSQYAADNGLPPEYVQQQRQAIEGQTYTMVMNRLADDSPLAARAFYERNKDAMQGEWGVVAEQIIDSKISVYEAEEVALQIAGSSEQKLSVWLQEANGIEDRDMRRKVREELTTRWREVENQQKEQVATAFNAIEDGSAPADIDPSVLALMSPQQRSTLETRYRQVQRAENPPMTMDAERLYLEFLNKQPQEIAAMTESDLLENYRTTLDDQHWGTVRNEWSRIRQAANQPSGANARGSLTSLISNKEIVDMQAARIGITPINESRGDWSDEEVSRYYAFVDKFQQAVDLLERQKGSQLTNSEVIELGKELGNSHVITQVRGSRWTGSTKLSNPIPEVALLDGETPMAIPYDDIPAQSIVALSSMREQITGIPPRTSGRQSREQKILMQRAYALFRVIEDIPEPDPRENPAGYQQWHSIASEVRAMLATQDGEFNPQLHRPPSRL